MFVTETVFQISVCSKDFGGSEVARFPKSASKIKGGGLSQSPPFFSGRATQGIREAVGSLSLPIST
jgi:hypothetical protein